MTARARSLVVAALAGVGVVALTVGGLVGTAPGRRLLIQVLNPTYSPPAIAMSDAGVFEGLDATRTQVPTRLVAVAKGFTQPTELVAVPDQPGVLLVLEKGGRLMWADTAAGTTGELASFNVAVASEMGLLGLAFAPDYATSRRVYVSFTVKGPEAGTSKVVAAQVSGPDVRTAKLAVQHDILTLIQPYANHDGGRVQVGPDGMLYIGFGDGGFRDDPHGNGQRGDTWLGSLLRVDPTVPPYQVPADNPFVGKPGFAPEAFAIGLRNPWGFGFTRDGRLVSADVGQDLWEEVNLVPAGANLGWKHREANTCFEPKVGCKTDGLTEPIAVYGREDGRSITGGVVVTADGPLRDRFVFGDFVTGRLWAIDVPDTPGKLQPLIALGRFALLPSAIGRDHDGNALVADFGSGTVYRLAAAAP